MADSKVTEPRAHSSVWDVLHHAMDTIPTESARHLLRSDADFHKEALLSGIAFIGSTLEGCQSGREFPQQFSRDELIALANFLASAPELIRGMDTLLDGYADNREGDGHA